MLLFCQAISICLPYQFSLGLCPDIPSFCFMNKGKGQNCAFLLPLWADGGNLLVPLPLSAYSVVRRQPLATPCGYVRRLSQDRSFLWIIDIFVRHSKRHEKTSSFLEEEITWITQYQNRPEGTTAKQWLSDNGIKEKAYHYWLRKFRKQAYAGQLIFERESMDLQ